MVLLGHDVPFVKQRAAMWYIVRGCVGNAAMGSSMVDRHGVPIEEKRQAALQRLQQSQARRQLSFPPVG